VVVLLIMALSRIVLHWLLLRFLPV
jgi:hypothetical protein